MQRKQIQFSERQIRAIRAEARRRKTSDAEGSIYGLPHDLGGTDRAPARGQLAARALAAVGRFASGRRDVSREHDRELADAFRK